MDAELPQAICRRIASALPEFSQFSETLIPLSDYSVYVAVAEECVKLLADRAEECTVIADASSVSHVEDLERLCRKAESAVVFGSESRKWVRAARVKVKKYTSLVQRHDRLLIIVSPTSAFVLLGTLQTLPERGPVQFHGGWSTHLPSPARPFLSLFGDNGSITRVHGNSEPTESGSPRNEIERRLMLSHVRALDTRQISISKDKDDLFSVLNILKAISAKRRAHDILFVFVEQIAHVIPSDRCSIVRVWGDDRFGHVLASHDDAHVDGRDIQLNKYPELLEAMGSRSKIVINGVSNHPLTSPHREELAKARIHSLLVIPIVLYDDVVGSLFLRAARCSGTFATREISFFEIVAEAASNALEKAQLFESIQVANERLERLAITDGLTGLYNHRHFRERLEAEFHRALRYNLPLSCLLFDIDDFKDINDTYGHLQGDAILREISQRTQQSVRHSDFVARYGGEEFVIIMPQTAAHGAFVEGERLREAIGQQPFQVGRDEARVTVSVGISTLSPEKMLTSEDLLRAADAALYEAKRSGKNKVVSSD